MIEKDKPVALIVKDVKESELFIYCLNKCGIRKSVTFTSAKEAYELVTRQQISFFITRVEMDDMNGLVFIQKIRETGNYGLETHMIVCNQIDPPKLNIFYEYDLPYVIVSPLKKETVVEKINHILTQESSLSEIEETYRSAKSAFTGKLYDMSEHMLKSIMQKDPNIEKVIILQGDIEFTRGQIDKAHATYQKALDLNPKSSVAAYKLGHCLLQQGQYQESAKILNNLTDLNKYNIKLLETAGLSNIKIEDYDMAEKCLGQIMSIDDKNSKATSMKVDIKIKKGDYDGIGDLLSKTHSETEMIQYLNNAGIKLSKEKDPATALKLYESCLLQFPVSKLLYAIYYNMGIAYRALNQPEKAKTILEKSLALKPDFEKAKILLNDILKNKK